MVETGGLENRCTGNRTGGSNPSPSATQSGLQRIPGLVFRQIRELCPFSAMSVRQTGLQRTDYGHMCALRSGLFLQSRNQESDFIRLVRRSLADQESIVKRIES